MIEFESQYKYCLKITIIRDDYMLDTSLPRNFKPTQLQMSVNDLSLVCKDLLPAFRDLMDDETHISMTEDGNYAATHDLTCLPFDWVDDWDENGYPLSLKPTIVAGYLRGGDFYTLLDLATIKHDS